MMRLYPEQLAAQLQKKLYPCYMLFGNDPLLLQECQDCIRARAEVLQFSEHVNITLDANTDWEVIFGICQSLSLFAYRQTLLLVLPENGVNSSYNKKLSMLALLLHEDLLFILRGNQLARSLENSTWFKTLSQNAVLVNCVTPEHTKLSSWVVARAKNMHLVLDGLSCQLLCYCYEGNLLALDQALERLSLVYPDGRLTLPRVEAAVNNASYFTPLHWVDAVLAGKSKRAAHILQQLRLKTSPSVVLLRCIQREVLLLLTLKRQMVDTSVQVLFEQHKVWHNRRTLLIQILQRLSLQKLHQAVILMYNIELTLKQDYDYPVWSDLNALALLLCGKSLPAVMIDE
ncbi:MAG: DNA polymerase III subunit delta [Sodalis sp. Fse]|nr:MAG: DNA polymerase III subunit delta [Sodalis sp. Fse]